MLLNSAIISLSFAVVLTQAVAAQHIVSFQPEFADIVDPEASIDIVANRSYAFAHEAGVYFEESNQIVFVSNILENDQGKFVEISSLDIESGSITKLNVDSIIMANGAAKTGANTLVFASQGLGAVGGSLISLNMDTMETKTIVDSWHGLQFSSPNDIITIGDGKFLFTDPPYAFAQRFRTGAQQLAPFVWYHDVQAEITKPILDGFVKPNGLCLSPDRTVLYVSDTGYITGDGKQDINAPRSIYAYDIQLRDGSARIPVIRNRRLFAVVDNGIPDGLKVDTKGNLYAGVGTGIDVFNPEGVLIGKILTPTGTGVANFVFEKDTLYMFAETHILSLKLNILSQICKRSSPDKNER